MWSSNRRSCCSTVLTTFWLLVVPVVMIPCGLSLAAEVSLFHVDGLNSDSTIPTGSPITFFFRVTNSTPFSIDFIQNHLVLYSPDGVAWSPAINIDTSVFCFPVCDTVYDSSLYAWQWIIPSGADSNYWSVQLQDFGMGANSDHDGNPLTVPFLGEGSDTLSFWASAGSDPGVPSGLDAVIWSFSLDSVKESSVGRHLCLDSSNYPLPASVVDSWMWHLKEPDSLLVPGWSGGLCLEIISCCQGIRGNVNLDLLDTINISDLTSLVGWMFKSGSAPPCMLEADVDGNSDHDIADVTHLVGYMFKSGPEPAGCP